LDAQPPDQPIHFIRQCIQKERIRWTYHGAKRLHERSLTAEMLVSAADTLEIIESYPEDKYLPSFLLKGRSGETMFHVHLAMDTTGDTVRVITMYRPDPDKWDASFRLRRVK
jgi:hypothetical protein